MLLRLHNIRLWIATLLAVVLIAFTAFAVNINTVRAATTYTVNSSADTGATGTLRDALNNLSSNPGEIININPGLVIPLGTNLPDIFYDVTINGNGSTLVGGTNIRGLTIAVGTVSITGLTIQNGNCNGGCSQSNLSGGAIFNSGTLTVSNSTFSNNSASFGGAIINESGGTLTVVNSTFSSNHALVNGFGSGNAGAIYNGGCCSASTLSVTASTFYNNDAANTAGAIYDGGSDIVTVTNSTFSSNSAAFQGGGIYNDNGTVALSSSTFSGNSAGLAGGGGAIYNNNIFGGTMSMANSIVANTPNGGGCAGNMVTGIGNNIVDDGTCIVGVTRALTFLAPLANNGGPTQTQALQAGSAAIGAGSACPATDQRGLPRKVLCDLGAFETQAVISVPAVFPAPPPIPLCSDSSGTTNSIVLANVPGGTITNGSVFCRVIAQNSTFIESANEIGIQSILNLGVVQAVDVFGLLAGGQSVVKFNNPVQICLAGSGAYYFIDASQSPRSAVQLPTVSTNGYACASIPNAGTVVLTQGAAVNSSGSSASAAVTRPLSMCTITTTAIINLHSAPNTSSSVLGLIPFNTTLSTTARQGDWYQVTFSGASGWAFAQYLTTFGSCG